MLSLEERVSYLEGKVEEHGRGFGEIRQMLIHVDQKMDRRFEAVDRRFDSVDTKFSWVVGIQVVLLLGVIGALLR